MPPTIIVVGDGKRCGKFKRKKTRRQLMQAASITVGTTAAQVPATVPQPQYGMRLIARAANSGDVYLGTSSAVTSGTGILVPKQNDSNTVPPFTVPKEHFEAGGAIYLIGSASGQVVDWSQN